MPTTTVINRPARSYRARSYSEKTGQLLSSTVVGPYLWNCDTVKTGVANPRWRTIIAEGGDASSPYSITKKSIEAGVVRFSARIRRNSGAYETWTHEDWPLTYQPSLPGMVNADFLSIKGAAVAAFYTEAANKVSAFKGMAFVGELRGTRALLASKLIDAMRLYRAMRIDVTKIWSRLRAAIKRYRSRKKLLIARAMDSVSRRYLEFTFGISPLIGDIENLSEVLCRVEISRVYLNSVRKMSPDDIVTAGRMGYIQNTLTAEVSTLKFVRLKSKVRGCLDLTKPAISNPLGGTATELGFHLREVIPTLWELKPFSFLIDYFVNVQDLLNTAMYADIKFVYANVSTLHTAVTQITVSKPIKANDSTWSYKVVGLNVPETRVNLRAFYFERAKVSPFLATVRLSIPPLGRKTANMIALFIQAFKNPSFRY